jgi:hypothetical protein
MTIRTEERAELREYLATAAGIAWDTCHKIYVLMDSEQVEQMRVLGYGEEEDPDSLITSSKQTPRQMSATISKWFRDSCSLRFIHAVATAPDGEEFFGIVPQR